ncbi:MAG: gluconate 2-dehydrogenase subunit 3 family protein [Verrucomicrobiota bacterium]
MQPATPETSSPATPDGMSRRAVLRLSAAGLLGASFGVGTAIGLTRWVRTTPQPYRFFSAAEAALLIALCEQIIPRDDAPGATDAGVIHYIDRQLCGKFADQQAAYRLGLAAFGKTCLQVYQMPFEQLSFTQQTEAVRLIEAEKAPRELWGEQSQQEFFSLVIDHTRQGFYGSPRHGGNRDYASYRMLGLAYPNIIGRNRYGSKRPD